MDDGGDPLAYKTLHALAPLMRHMLTRVGGIRARPLEPATTGSRDLPIPLNQDAFDDSNLLWATLVTTTETVSLDTGTRAPDAIRAVWRDDARRPIGLPYGTSPDAGYEHTKSVTRWLEYQAPLPYLDTLIEVAHEVSPRHPIKARPRVTSDAVCETDGGSLLVKPPRDYLDDQIAVCQSCGRVYSQDELQLTVTRYAAVQARERVQARADAARRHLAAKYGSIA